MTILVRVIVSGLLIGLVTLIAQRSPTLGGWLTAFPVISLISASWLFADGSSSTQLANYFGGVLFGAVLTVIFVVVVGWCFRQGFPFFVAIGVGLFIWGLFFFVAQRLGWGGL